MGWSVSIESEWEVSDGISRIIDGEERGEGTRGEGQKVETRFTVDFGITAMFW